MAYITRDGTILISAPVDDKYVHEVNVDGVPITFIKEEDTGWFKVESGTTKNIDLSNAIEIISAEVRWRGRSQQTTHGHTTGYTGWTTATSTGPDDGVVLSRNAPGIPGAPYG